MTRLVIAYGLGLLYAAATVGTISSILFVVNIGEYRFLGFMMSGWVEAGFGEYHGRLLLFLGLLFVPLSIFFGLPVLYVIKRKSRLELGHFILLGVCFGLITGFFLMLQNIMWGPFGLLFGIVWAIVFYLTAGGSANRDDHLRDSSIAPPIKSAPAPEIERNGEASSARQISAKSPHVLHFAPLLFAISLALPAVTLHEGTGVHTYPGFQVFLVTLFLSGGGLAGLGGFISCILGTVANLSFFLSRVTDMRRPVAVSQ